VGRKLNGVITRRWLYQNQLNPVAELDGAGNLTRFVYGTRANVPDYVLEGWNVTAWSAIACLVLGRLPTSRGTKQKMTRHSGFTLIGILVVIVVITILATLVAPNVFQHVGAAKDATAKSQIEMPGTGLVNTAVALGLPLA